jgi:MoaA/NifB/PqqE/SkfB family radical SAM enzyme
MPYIKQNCDYEFLIHVLRALKLFHDIGIYSVVTSGMQSVNIDDFYELADLGIECVAPLFQREDVAMDAEETPITDEELAQAVEEDQYCDGHCHIVYRFSSPEMMEYYRLCRLYEHREGLEPKDNPFVKEADRHFSGWAMSVSGYLWIGFDSDIHTTQLVTESCTDQDYDRMDLITAIHKTLQFYKEL